MAILKIRDENGNIQEILALRGRQGDKGDSYILTEDDKQEIAEIISAKGPTSEEVMHMLNGVYASEPGLYNEDDELLISWEILVNNYGLDIFKDYTSSTVKTDSTSCYNVLLNLSESLMTEKFKLYLPEFTAEN